MVFQRLFRTKPARAAGQALYASAAHQARDPAFYRELGAADTGEGRFELYSLHVALLVLRLKGQGPPATELSQALFDAFIKALDDGLREMGVGDLVVGKRMRKLGEAFYGRARALEEALQRRPDRAPLDEVMVRTVLEGGGDQAHAPALADYVVRATAWLAGQPLEDLMQGQVGWPEVMS
jgi:cytochrome b pre-mRNA-processing protein 3